MPVLSDAELMPDWVAAGFATPPWESVEDLLPEVPEWLLDSPVRDEEPGCECLRCAALSCTAPTPARESELAGRTAEEPVRWAVPGVWDDQPPVERIGVLVSRLLDDLSALERVEVTSLPGGRALAECEALLDVQRRVRVLGMARAEDVRARELFEQGGYRGFTAWYRTVAPDAAVGDPSLARKLTVFQGVAEAVQAGTVSLMAAGKLTRTLARMRPSLDPPDGLIDGCPAEEVVTAVVGNVLDLICQDTFGLTPDPTVDPGAAARLGELETTVAAIQGSGGSQGERVERALLLLAEHVHPSRLDAPLEQLLLALIPAILEDREAAAQDKRRLSLKPAPDGMWDLRATLDAETGELLFTALSAEAHRDPTNPEDTAARARARAAAAEQAGGDPWAEGAPAQPWEHTPDASLPDGHLLVPRSPSVRLHDALRRLLSRYLQHGLGGRHGKVPVQITVTVSERTVTATPGAPPPKGASGRPLARSLLRRWWCDAHVTTLLLSRGWTALGIVHTARTLTATELKAARVQYDNRCAGLGCCPGVPDPLIPLVPHHVRRHALTGTTSLDETILCCERLHADIHLGKKTIRLRDGRLITEDGYLSNS